MYGGGDLNASQFGGGGFVQADGDLGEFRVRRTARKKKRETERDDPPFASFQS